MEGITDEILVAWRNFFEKCAFFATLPNKIGGKTKI
jgi:hypothetical protein